MNRENPIENLNFGEQLTQLMQEKSISNEELASQIGIPLEELIAWKTAEKMPDSRDPGILKSLRICTKRLGQDDIFFRKGWFGGLLNAYMEAINLGDKRLADYTGLGRITIHRWRKGVVLPAINRERVVTSLNACTQILQLTRLQTEEFLKAARTECSISPISGPTPSRPTSHPSQFFGRELLLRKIYTAWRREDLQNLSVVGPRASGKTSLLYYLREITKVHSTTLRGNQPVGWETGWLPYDFRYALVEFKERNDWTPKMVNCAILGSLNIEYYENQMGIQVEFERHLLQQRGSIVILMDDIHEALKVEALNGNFWRSLRALAQGGRKADLAFLTTSRQDPQEIIKTHRQDLRQEDSPFSNTFTTIQLEQLTESEAYTMLDYMGCFSDAEKVWVIKESGCWPKLLQILCEEKFSNYDDSWKTEGLKHIKRLEDTA